MATKIAGNTTLTYSVDSTGASSTVVTVSLKKTVKKNVSVPPRSEITVTLTASGTVGSLDGSGSQSVRLTNSEAQTASMTATGVVSIISNRTITYPKGTSPSTKSLSFSSSPDSGKVDIAVPALDNYTVSYNANGGSGAPASQKKYYGKTLTLQTAKPTKTGHTFSTWNTNASGTGTNYSSGGSYTANSGATLYAIYVANKYTITYSANGGSGTVASQTKTYNVALTLQDGNALKKQATIDGAIVEYELIKWNTSADGSGTDYELSSSAPNITANLALYAVWEPKYIYPTINNVIIKRNDTADMSDTTETDDGRYIRISFDWSGYSEDGGVTTETPSCTITIGEDEYEPTLTNNFTFKPPVEYSSDEAFRVVITLSDPDYPASSATVNTIAATAILPIDLLAHENGVSMGIMHPAVDEQTVTFPSEVYIQTDVDKESVTALYIDNKDTDISMWVGISKFGSRYGMFSKTSSRWIISQDGTDTFISGDRIKIEKHGTVTAYPTADSDGSGFNVEHGFANKNTAFSAKRTDTNTRVWLGIGAGGINHGVYSSKLDKWLLHGDASNVYVNNINTANIVQKGDIVTQEHTIKTGFSVNSGSQSAFTGTATKSGYYPLGVVGWRCLNGSGSGGSYCLNHSVRISSASNGSATVSVGARAVGGNVSNCNFNVDILWRKV